MGATSRRSKSRPVRSVSKASAHDDASDLDASYDPRNAKRVARRGRRSESDNDDRASMVRKGVAHDPNRHIGGALLPVWRTLSNFFNDAPMWFRRWTTCLMMPVAAILMFIGGCIILSILTDFTVNSTYAIACRTPASWIHWTGLPWLFQPNKVCTNTDEDPYEAIWDDTTGAVALLKTSETIQQLQRTREASENYSYQLAKFHAKIRNEEEDIPRGKEVLVLVEEWERLHQSSEDSLDSLLVKDRALRQSILSESYALVHDIAWHGDDLAISNDWGLRYAFTSLLFGDSPGGNLARKLDDWHEEDRLSSRTWELLYSCVSTLYPYSPVGKIVGKFESFAREHEPATFELVDAAYRVRTALEKEGFVRERLIALLPLAAWQEWEAACFWRQHKFKAALLSKSVITGDGTHCEGVDFEKLQEFLLRESGAWIKNTQKVLGKAQLQYTRLGEKYRETITTSYHGRSNPGSRQRLTDSTRMNLRKIQAEIADSAERLETALKRQRPPTIGSQP